MGLQKRVIFTGGLLGLLMLNALSLFADEAVARMLFDSGMEKLRRGETAAAAEDFLRSFDEHQSPSSLINLAECYVILDRHFDALTRFKMLLSLFSDRLSVAKQTLVLQQIAELEKQVPSLSIISVPEGAEVCVDGNTVGETPIDEPIVVQPGTHQLTVSAHGYAPLRRTVVVSSYEHRKEIVELEKRAVPAVTTTGTVRLDRNRMMKANLLLLTGLSGTAIMAGVSIGLWTAAVARWNDYHEKNDILETDWSDDLSAAQRTDRVLAEKYNIVAVITTVTTGAFLSLTVATLIRRRAGRKQGLNDIALSPGGVGVRF
jgi:hypothetical protein